jgi:hypothetical protein
MLPDHLAGQIESACQGLAIPAEQVRRELEEDGGLQDLASGEFTPHGLRLGAKSLATLRYIESMNSDSPDPAKGRRQELLDMLAQERDVQYAVASDDKSEPDAVIVTLAIRGKATCDLDPERPLRWLGATTSDRETHR